MQCREGTDQSCQRPYTYLCLVLEANLIREPLVIFVCATTGQGDPPDNMKVRLFSLLYKSPNVHRNSFPSTHVVYERCL